MSCKTRRSVSSVAAAAIALIFMKEMGLPERVAAETRVVNSALPQPKSQVQAFPLKDVRLLDGPFKTAMGRDTAYLLSLEPDRLLSRFRTEAGLEPKAKSYGGWDSEGVAGCILGHYLSAASMAYASTSDDQFKQRVDLLVDGLKICQDKIGNGYVGAIPDWRNSFENLKARQGKMIGWVPWYTVHKYMAGLRDSYRIAGNEKAREVLIKLADWVGNTTDPLTDAEMQAMLETEQGGMTETLADVWAMTGDKKYLKLANRFTHHSVLDPLAAGQDKLDGLHANTQIPKLIGAARIFMLSGDSYYGNAANTFWTTVTRNRTWAIGGNGDAECFFNPALAEKHLSGITAETCNVYNMIKLTNDEFQIDPRIECADYAERALFNQILGSQDPKRGMFTYHQSLRPGGFKIYSDPENAMWCCVGTGMENHVRYGESIYFHDDQSLYVNLFIASELNWADKGLKITQETDFPNKPTTKLIMHCDQPRKATVQLRVPAWIAGAATIKINGELPDVTAKPDSYAKIERDWKDGDTIEYEMPMNVRVEKLHGSDDEVALTYGPVILAADLGTKGLEPVHFYEINHRETAYSRFPTVPVPALVGSVDDLPKHVKMVAGDAPLTFKTEGLGRPEEMTLRPYAQTHFVRYAVYLKNFPTIDAYDAAEAELATAREARRLLDARTIDLVKPGEQQPEVDHHLKSEQSFSDLFQDGHWRDARSGGWFEYSIKVAAEGSTDLICTYWGSDHSDRTFNILVDGKVIATQTIESNKPGEYFEVTYPIPPALTRGKSSVVVRFASSPGKTAGGVFGVRTVNGNSK